MSFSNSNHFTLTWENISAWTKHTGESKGRKRLLCGVSGMAKSGILTAILSPSGAGKTTLLAVLSKRYKGQTSGEVKVNGSELCEKDMSCISGYVSQKDQNYDNLTVYEHLIFMARLKLDKNTTPDFCHQTVLKVTDNLILSHKLYTIIALLSGGQKKRLGLAVQLLTETKILFCDEPTTGLDSYSAEQVVKLLRAIANDGKIVICSIHQPASGIFEAFDNVSLLASGGRLAFHGPVSTINSFLSGLGAKCPKNFNLSEFIVSQVTVKSTFCLNGQDEKSRVQYIIDAFTQSEICDNLIFDIKNVTNESKALRLQIKMFKRESASFRTQFNWSFWRTMLLFKNSYRPTLLNLSINAILTLFIGLNYRGFFDNDQKKIQNIFGFFAMMVMQMAYASTFSIYDEVQSDIYICAFETADHLYSPLAFYLSKSAFQTAVITVQNIIFVSLGYWGSGLSQTIGDLLMITVITVWVSTVVCAFAFFLATAFERMETIYLCYVPLEFFNRLLSGIQLKISSLPWFLAILKYLSYQYFGFEALNIIEWSKYDHLNCDSKNGIPCYKSGDEVLASLGFKRDHLPVDIIGLILITLLLHLLAYALLLRRLKLCATY